YVDRRCFYLIGAIDRGCGTGMVRHDQSQVLCARHGFEARAYSGEFKPRHPRGCEIDVHRTPPSAALYARGGAEKTRPALALGRSGDPTMATPANPASASAAGSDRELFAVAALVLLARAAGTGGVAPDLVRVALDCLWAGVLGLAAVAHHHFLRLGLLLHLLDILLTGDLHRETLLDHVPLHGRHQCLQHREPFLLIFDQRVFLRLPPHP